VVELIKEAGRLFKELVIGIQGMRGGGKDCLGSYLACCYMLGGIPCMSNMPIRGTFAEGSVASMPLDINKLYKFDKHFESNVVIYISEIDKLVHRRRSISTANMLLNILATQIRKKGITIIANAQDWFWLDAEWIFQTDILINTKDLAFTNYAEEEYVPEGFTSFLQYYDISGATTKHPYKETGLPYRQDHFNMRMMWDRKVNGQGPMFDSYSVMGVEQIMSKVKLHRDTVNVRPEYGAVDFHNQEDIGGFLPASQAYGAIKSAVDFYRNTGIREVSSSEITQLLSTKGLKCILPW